MDDIGEKLADILNDPNSLKRVREMAESILGNSGDKKSESPPISNINSLFGEDFDPAQIGKIISIMSRLKSTSDDNREKLLLALKPHLSAPRREKIDTAIKIIKLIDMLPLLRESGVFEI